MFGEQRSFLMKVDKKLGFSLTKQIEEMGYDHSREIHSGGKWLGRAFLAKKQQWHKI